MLGLSQGVSSSAGIYERFPVVSYESDFSSSADGFTAFLDNSPSAATLTANVDFGGKTDVLRISWSANEADGLFYIRKSFSDLDDQDSLSPVINFSADIYYDFTTSGDVSTVVGAATPLVGMYEAKPCSGSMGYYKWINKTRYLRRF